MGRRTHHHHHKVDSMRSSQTLPPSPTHSSSSSDFEFTISNSQSLLVNHPHSSAQPMSFSTKANSFLSTSHLVSPCSSSFTSDIVLLDCDSSRPSSVTDLDDELKKLNINNGNRHSQMKKSGTSKYFNLLKLSSVFKHNKTRDPDTTTNTSTTTTNLSGSGRVGSIRSSPSHSGVLSSSRNNKVHNNNNNNNAYDTTSSSMEELQSAIQGAIAHCKNSMLQTTTKSLITNYQV
ncbi:hypothetical protein ACFE04_010800 [Oxalis oulophora]